MSDLANAHLDVELVIEAQRRAVLHVRLADGEVDAMRDEVALVLDAELPQVCDTADLCVQQVVRVVHDLLQICFAVTNSLTMRERECLHARQVTGLARSLLAHRAWQYDTMTIRPNASSGSNANALSMSTTGRSRLGP